MISGIGPITTVKIDEIKEGGILLTHISKAYKTQGIAIIKYKTNLKLVEDQLIMQDVISDFTKLCTMLQTVNTTNCKILEDSLTSMIKEIQIVPSTTRSKRNSGIFGVLKEILFGIDETEKHLEQYKEKQNVWNQQTQSVFKEILNTLNITDHKTTSNLNDVQSTMKEVTLRINELYKWGNELNSSIANEYVMMSYTKSRAIIEIIKNNYLEITSHELTKDDIENMNIKLNETLMMLNYSKQNCKKQIITIEDQIVIQYEVPIVSKSQNEIFEAISVPNHDVMIDLQDQFLVLDHTSMMYESFKDLSLFKEYDQDIMIFPNIVLKKVQWQMNCLVSTILKKKESKELCKLKKVIDQYDIMVKPVKANKIIVLTTFPEDTYIICDNIRTLINMTKFMISLDEGCILHSRTSAYTADVSTMSEVVHQYFRPMKDIIDPNHIELLQESRRIKNWNISKPLKDVDLTKLNRKLDELRIPQEDQDLTFHFYILGAVTVIVILIMLLGIYLYCSIKFKSISMISSLIKEKESEIVRKQDIRPKDNWPITEVVK